MGQGEDLDLGHYTASVKDPKQAAEAARRPGWLHLSPSSPTHWLCDPGQVPDALRAPVSSSGEWGVGFPQQQVEVGVKTENGREVSHSVLTFRGAQHAILIHFIMTVIIIVNYHAYPIRGQAVLCPQEAWLQGIQ